MNVAFGDQFDLENFNYEKITKKFIANLGASGFLEFGFLDEEGFEYNLFLSKDPLDPHRTGPIIQIFDPASLEMLSPYRNPNLKLRVDSLISWIKK